MSHEPYNASAHAAQALDRLGASIDSTVDALGQRADMVDTYNANTLLALDRLGERIDDAATRVACAVLVCAVAIGAWCVMWVVRAWR